MWGVPQHCYYYYYLQEHGKDYEDELTELHRYNIWKSSLALIEEHNREADKHGYTLGINRFGDITNKEFNEMYNGYRITNHKRADSTFEPDPNFKLSNDSFVDWRKEGVVTPVANQGDCGSCWAFSATGSLEAQHALHGSTLVSLSEQNIMDCTESKKYGNMACLGGTMDKAFQYVIDNKGIDSEASYPYLAHTETTCRYNQANMAATMSGFKDVPINEYALSEACLKVGPISIAIDASLESFRFYKNGTYYEIQCSTTLLNHGVLLVGYGTDGYGKDYYLVKNSWGTNWGMEGYIKMSRNRDNNCGIASVASYPVVV